MEIKNDPNSLTRGCTSANHSLSKYYIITIVNRIVIFFRRQYQHRTVRQLEEKSSGREAAKGAYFTAKSNFGEASDGEEQDGGGYVKHFDFSSENNFVGFDSFCTNLIYSV